MSIGDFPDPDENREITERSKRLRQAVRAAGGNQVVAARAGMHLGTLNRYIAGRDMKAGAMIRLAQACNVSLEWLATGQESMPAAQSPRAQPEPPSSVSPDMPSDLFHTVDVDKLVGCIEAAQEEFARRNRTPSLRRVMQVALVLYDALAAEEAEKASITAVVTSTDATLKT